MDKRKSSKSRVNEIDILNHMLTSLVELLEEKGMLTHKEWEERIRKKIEEASGLISYRELKFRGK